MKNKEIVNENDLLARLRAGKDIIINAPEPLIVLGKKGKKNFVFQTMDIRGSHTMKFQAIYGLACCYGLFEYCLNDIKTLQDAIKMFNNVVIVHNNSGSSNDFLDKLRDPKINIHLLLDQDLPKKKLCGQGPCAYEKEVFNIAFFKKGATVITPSLIGDNVNLLALGYCDEPKLDIIPSNYGIILIRIAKKMGKRNEVILGFIYNSKLDLIK